MSDGVSARLLSTHRRHQGAIHSAVVALLVDQQHAARTASVIIHNYNYNYNYNDDLVRVRVVDDDALRAVASIRWRRGAHSLGSGWQLMCA